MALGVAALVVACGTSGPTPPTPPDSTSPGPAASASLPPVLTPGPTPAPLDASAAFNATLADPLFSARIAITDTRQVADRVSSTTGTLDIRGATSHTILTTVTDGKANTTESITANGSTYTTSWGLWFESAGAVTDDLAAVIGGLGGFRDTGVETKDGALLHRMAPPVQTAIPPAAFGLTGKAIGNVVLGLEAWAEEDGTPVLMTVSAVWDQVVGKKTVAATMTMDLAFAGVGSAPTIAVPTELWATHTSTRFDYRIAHPVDWAFEKGSSRRYADVFWGFDGDGVSVWRGRRAGYTLNQLSSGISRFLPEITGIKTLKVDSNKSARLGGAKARQIEYHGTYKGQAFWSIAYLAVKGDFLYLVEYTTLGRTTDAHRALFAKFVSSFAYR